MGGFRVLCRSLGHGQLVANNCPFCNGVSILKHGRTPVNEVTSYVECKDCGAKTKEVAISEEYSCNDEAIALWNTRYVEDDEE